MATIKSIIQYKHLNQSSDPIPAGTGVQFGTHAFGVACAAIAPGSEGVLDAVGVFTLPIAPTVTASAGARAYWDAGGSKVLASSSGKLFIGVFSKPVASGETVCEVAVFPTGSTGSVS